MENLGYHYVRKHPYYEWWFHLNITLYQVKIGVSSLNVVDPTIPWLELETKKNTFESLRCLASQAFCSISKWLLSSNDTIAVFVDIFEDLKVFEKEGSQKVKRSSTSCAEKNAPSKDQSFITKNNGGFSRKNGGCSMATYMPVD